MVYDTFNYNEFANSLQKARIYANKYKYKCYCPNCENNAIKSHLLQRNPLLSSIADEYNKLLQFEDNWEDARSGRIDFYSLKADKGINDAMQYPLFCKAHNSSLFKDLESHNSVPNSKQDCLLLAYRAACSVRHQEERRLHLYEYKVQRDNNDLNCLLIENSVAFIRRMDAVIDNLWNALKGEDGSYEFRMISGPYLPVAVSDCIIDENDYVDHLLDEGYSNPLNCYFINLIPENKKINILLGCDTRFDRNGEYRSIIEGFPADCDIDNQYFLETIWGILLKCHNWCCSPNLTNDPAWSNFFEKYERNKVNDVLRP